MRNQLFDCATNSFGESLRRTESSTRACSYREICTGCGDKKPLADFPPRGDRVGLHAMCYACRADWSHRYRQANPEPIREGSRRRRARIRGSRVEPYKDRDILARDESLCWFCKEEIDSSLQYPDPLALSIHHIHPIAKQGPDINKNVAPAHFKCNHAAKDKYVPQYREWVAAPIPYGHAKMLIEHHHYLHKMPPSSFVYGLIDGDMVRGVVVFGTPPSNRIRTSVSKDPSQVIELSRLWISDEAPFGVGSWFLSRALKQLPARIVVSYSDLGQADPRYGTAHNGVIYRACNFNYAGTSRPNVEWRLPGSTRNSGKVPGAVQVQISSKCRYWTITGSPTDKKCLRQLVKWPVLKYEPMVLSLT